MVFAPSGGEWPFRFDGLGLSQLERAEGRVGLRAFHQATMTLSAVGFNSATGERTHFCSGSRGGMPAASPTRQKLLTFLTYSLQRRKGVSLVPLADVSTRSKVREQS